MSEFAEVNWVGKRRFGFGWALPVLFLLAGCGVASTPGYEVQRSPDGTLSGVVVTLRVLDRREAVAAFTPGTVVLRDANFVRWVSLSSKLRQLVIRDSIDGSETSGDTFVLTVNDNGAEDYSCDFEYSSSAPLLVANYRGRQE